MNLLTKLQSIFFKNSNWDKKNVVLIVSTGRTGTKFFYEFFKKITFKALATHEPKPDIVPTAINFAAQRINKKTAVDEILSLRFKTLKLLNKKGIDNYIESNGGFIFLSPILNSIFKNVVVIHIIRNPFDWVLSAYNRQDKGIARYNSEKNWKFSGKDIKGFKNIDWEKSSTLQKLAWTWFIKNKMLLDAYGNSENYICLRFEDIFSSESGEKEVLKIVEFIKSNTTIDFKFSEKIDLKKTLSQKSNANSTEFLDDIRNHPEFDEKKFLDLVNPIYQQFYS